MAPFCAPPPCAPQCELVSPSVTLAPRGELVIHLSRSHRVASSFHHFARSHRLASSLSSFFYISFSIGGAFVPFNWKRASHYVTTLKQQKGSKAVVSRSIIVVSPSSCRCPCSWSHRCLRLCRSLTYLSHLVRITKIAAVFALRLVITLAALWSRLTILGYSAPGTLRSALQWRKRP